MAKLKPCPFCGGKAKIMECDQELPFSEKISIFFVCCKECGCSPFHFSEVNLYYKENCKIIADELRKKAIEAWNRRADND